MYIITDSEGFVIDIAYTKEDAEAKQAEAAVINE